MSDQPLNKNIVQMGLKESEKENLIWKPYPDMARSGHILAAMMVSLMDKGSLGQALGQVFDEDEDKNNEDLKKDTLVKPIGKRKLL